VIRNDVSVTEHVHGPQKEYSLYTIYHRAIPSLVDGFKPVQRKAVYTALKTCKNKLIKTIALTGYTFPLAEYHHGDVSMTNAIIAMSGQWNNNVPIFEGDGSFGSRMVPSAAEPRYTHVKMSKEFEKYFPDHDICPENDDPENPEPAYYLPVIPWVLVNGVKGSAVGFATHILPRDPSDLARACESALKGKPVEVAPTFPMFTGTVEKTEKPNQWRVNGVINRRTSTKVTITDVPVGYTRAKYIETLDTLKESKVIVNYLDKCSRKGFEFEVTLPNSAKSWSDDDVIKKLKLTTTLTENLGVIDENGLLRYFESTADLIAHFVNFRLGMYDVRYKTWMLRDQDRLFELEERQRFIRQVLSGFYDFKNMTREQVVSLMRKDSYRKEHIEKFLSLPMTSLTKDADARIETEKKTLATDIVSWKNIDIKKQFVKELKSL